jgi:AraC family transcriptional regulator
MSRHQDRSNGLRRKLVLPVLAGMGGRMNLVSKALWYIESHFAEEISLDDIASAGDVSRFHMSRAFGLATGRSVMRYVRGRRLTEAARSLGRGAPDILGVALDAGYGSHEAFTRAFREQFGTTPEIVRLRGHVENLELMEPIKMNETVAVNLEEPRREAGGPLLIAGMGVRYSNETIAGIPMQWQRFAPHIDAIPGRVDGKAYGVCCDFDESGHFDYVCGVAVSSLSGIARELRGVRVPAHDYLVFRHHGHVSGIHATWQAIMGTWLPASGFRLADTPNFERYAEDFDGATGIGGVEIWIPVRNGKPGE